MYKEQYSCDRLPPSICSSLVIVVVQVAALTIFAVIGPFGGAVTDRVALDADPIRTVAR